MKKYISFGIGIALFVSPVFASAQTVSSLQAQLQSLEAEIAALQVQGTANVSGSANVSNSQTCINLTFVGGVGTSGSQVSSLQTFLGINPATGYFGTKTKAALTVWQSAHGVSATGYFGPLTRTAMGCAGNSSSASNASSNINFSASPASGPAPLSVTFDATGNPANYAVNFGDGSPVESCNEGVGGNQCSGTTGWALAHSYANPGTYTVVLSNNSSIVAQTVIVVTNGSSGNSNPSTSSTVPFTATPVSGAAPLTVTFSAPENYGSESTNYWQVNFGDGQTSNSGLGFSSTPHVYSASGTYTAQLQEANNNCAYATGSCTLSLPLNFSTVSTASVIVGSPSPTSQSTTVASQASATINQNSLTATNPPASVTITGNAANMNGSYVEVQLSQSQANTGLVGGFSETLPALVTNGNWSVTYTLGATSQGSFTVNVYGPMTSLYAQFTPGANNLLATGTLTVTHPLPSSESATIDQNSLASGSSEPTITGTASNIGGPDLQLVIAGPLNASGATNNLFSVPLQSNGTWSLSVSQPLASGTYTVRVDDWSFNVLTSGTLTVTQ